MEARGAADRVILAEVRLSFAAQRREKPTMEATNGTSKFIVPIALKGRRANNALDRSFLRRLSPGRERRGWGRQRCRKSANGAQILNKEGIGGLSGGFVRRAQKRG